VISLVPKEYSLTELSLLETLYISESRYRGVFESALDGIILLNADTAQIEDVNPFLIDMLGYSYEEFIGKKIWELGAFKNTELSQDAFAELQHKRPIRYHDQPLVTKSGEVISVEFISHLYICSGVDVIQCIIRDNTKLNLSDFAFGVKALRAGVVNKVHEEQLRVCFEQTIQAFADTIEARDVHTAVHQRRVADISSAISAAIAKELGLSLSRVRGLHLAATVHDLGKISIPVEILTKPGRLNEAEYGLIKQHSNIGYELLKNIPFPWPIAKIVLQHHERIDGSGYPFGLKGDDILLESKILGVADTVDAMASHRPYRPALGIDAALNEIKAQRGITFDGEVVDACLRVFYDKKYVLEA